MSQSEPQMMPNPAEMPPAPQAPSRGWRWITPLVILILGVVGGWALWSLDDRLAFARIAGLALWCFTGFVLVCWMTFLSPLSREIRYGFGVVALIGVASFFTYYRVEQWTGDMIPILAPRFSPTAADQVRAYRDSLEAREDEGGIDLKTTSPTDYPGFLGENRLGVVPDVELATDWESQPPVKLWEHEVGLGWSSFAIVGDYAVTQELLDKKHCVVCYEIATGHPVWTYTGEAGFIDTTGMGGNGPRATPTIDEGRVYALGGTGEFVCLNGANGEVIWKRNILEDVEGVNITWGLASSPLIYQDMVIVPPGGKPTEKAEDGRGALVAYNKDSGEIVWESDTYEKISYASPTIATIDGMEQILCLTGPGLSGYDPETGKRLWHFPWVTNGAEMINTTQPMVLNQWGFAADDNRIFISTGYNKGCALIRVLREGEGWKAEQVWFNNNLESKFTNLYIKDGAVFGMHERILTALDLETGKRLWRKRNDIEYGQLLWVGDLLLAQCETGPVQLWRVTREDGEELASFDALKTKTWNCPALSGDRLLVRNDRKAACYRLPLKTPLPAGEDVTE